MSRLVPPSCSRLVPLGCFSAWPPSVVLRSAFRAGSLAAVRLRVSRRSFCGAVLVCSFGRLPAARAFAARWSARCGVACVLRWGAGVWSVSVPVVAAVPSLSVVPGGLPFAVAGRGAAGVARLAAVLPAC